MKKESRIIHPQEETCCLKHQTGHKCMACWLVEAWEKQDDPRAMREDRYKLAAQINVMIELLS